MKGGESMARKRNRSNSNKNKHRQKTLKYQMETAIVKNFQQGTKKRAAKMSENGTGATIYSESHKNNLLAFAGMFSSFCKDIYGVKNVNEIKPEHAKAFMIHKAQTCADSTLATYHQHLNKLSKCFNKVFTSCEGSITFGWNIPPGNNNTKQRDVKISRESMDNILSKMDMKYGTHRAIMLSEALGLRVSESVKVKGEFIDLERGVVGVVGKGGKYREIPIREDRRELLAKFKSEYPDVRIADVKPNSVNATFHRACEREGITDLKDSKSGIHAVRKLWATELYEEKLREGVNERDAWGDVSFVLGHGRDRSDLFKVYIVQ